MRAQPRRRVRRDHGGRPAPGRPAAAGRSACPVALRSVTLSVPDLARSEAFFRHGLGLPRSAAPLRAPEHEALWGLAGARTQQRVRRRQRARRAGAVPRSDRAPAPAGPPDLRSGHPQHRLRRPTPPRSPRALPPRTAAGARANRRPLHRPGPASSTSTTQTSSRSSFCGCPRLGEALGLHAPTGGQAATRGHARDRANVRIAAPAQATWDVIADQSACRNGSASAPSGGPSTAHPFPTARGSERLLKLLGASITEQVVGYQPPARTATA